MEVRSRLQRIRVKFSQLKTKVRLRLKKFKNEDFPVLSTDQHRVLENLDYEFSDALEADSRPFIQSEKTRTYAVSFFNAFFSFYKTKISPDAELCDAAMLQAYWRVMSILSDRNSYIWSRYRDKKETAQKLVAKTLEDHAKSVASGLPRLNAPAQRADASAQIKPPVPPSIAEQLKALKTESEITYQKLADVLDVDITTVQRHLSGKLKPRADKIALYEKVFGEGLGRLVKIKRPNNAIETP
jgi:hypothetical protein